MKKKLATLDYMFYLRDKRKDDYDGQNLNKLSLMNECVCVK